MELGADDTVALGKDHPAVLSAEDTAAMGKDDPAVLDMDDAATLGPPVSHAVAATPGAEDATDLIARGGTPPFSFCWGRAKPRGGRWGSE